MLEAIKLWGYSDIILPGRSDVVQLTAPIAPDAAAFLSRRIGYNPSLVPVDYQHFLGDRESRLRSLHNGQKRAVLGLHDIFNTGLAGHRVFRPEGCPDCAMIAPCSRRPGRFAPASPMPQAASWTKLARGALAIARSGRRDGRSGRTMGWIGRGHAAAFSAPARLGSNSVCVLNIAQATASIRSATVRNARP
jgi:hypothetical protein